MGYATPFKPGLVVYASFPEVFADNAQLLRRLEQVARDEIFEVVEIPFAEEPGLERRIRAILDAACLDVVASAGAACLKLGRGLSATDVAVRKQAVERLQRAVDFAYAVGARILLLMSGKDPGMGEREEAGKALVGSLQELADYARKQATDYILCLSLEPTDRELAHRQLLGPSVEVAPLIAAAREHSPALGVTLDLSHIAQLGESLEEATARLGGLVVHAHLANAVVRDPSRPDYGDQHPTFGVPGGEYGVLDASRFLQLLFERCFSRAPYLPHDKPVISLEVKPAPGQDPDLVLAGTKRTLRKLLTGKVCPRLGVTIPARAAAAGNSISAAWPLPTG